MRVTPRSCRIAPVRPKTRPSPTSRWRRARRRSRPVRCRVPAASPSTTSCCASSRSWAPKPSTRASRHCRCRCPACPAEGPPIRSAMKFLAAGLLILLVLLQYRLWLGEGGMREVTRLRAEIVTQRDKNQQLKERNRTLGAEVQDLKKGTVAIEERARTDLGMVGKGETFYQVVTPKTAPAASSESKDAAPATEAGAPPQND